MTAGNPSPGPAGPVVARRRLAGELRLRREQARLTIDETAAQLEWSGAKISRIENAKVSVLPRDVKFLLGIYGTHDAADRELLLELARQSREKAWWHQYGISDIPAWSRTWADLEAEAALLCSYHPELVPALLQTPEYHHALQDAAVPAGPGSDQLAALFRARQARHAATATPRLHAIISEAVIRRPIGSPAVMAGQLGHLASAADQNPGITIQVLPFAAGAHPALDTPFALMTFPGPADPDIACTGPHSAMYLDAAADVQHYQHAFARLAGMALSPAESLALTTQAAGELTRPLPTSDNQAAPAA
jgi:transcriptional regulator with XRE-family HTH domain